ncbi:hypothetical protein GCM10023350_15750 [Nocardioides endophyticus]|uniref:Excreted virulence factor EspC (Type VII ESX diderm) n=1 Tax=Nocardioides endophyticus TaxID=1353775 RepID=A0ABP8YL03_9ACTN
MEAVPFTMGMTARSWDEQHLTLQAASDQVAAAPTGGFTSGVAGAAARFAATWQRHVAELGTTAEARADGLRTSAADYVRTDNLVATNQVFLDTALREDR